MIKEEYVTFETAKLLKEAGFPIESIVVGHNGIHNEFAEVLTTQAQAMRWLREVKDIFVDIENRYGKGTAQWDFKLVDIDNMDNILEFAKNLEYTYEAAAEAGIKAACKYLIGK